MDALLKRTVRMMIVIVLVWMGIGCASTQMPPDSLKSILERKGEKISSGTGDHSIPPEQGSGYSTGMDAGYSPAEPLKRENSPGDAIIQSSDTVGGRNRDRSKPTPGKDLNKNIATSPSKYDIALKKLAAGPAEKTSDDDGIALNFDNADLYEVIRAMAERLEIDYILDPAVSGTVTIQTAGKLSRKELWPVFFQILETNGITAVREGRIYRIIPMKDASRLPILSRYGMDTEEVGLTERVVMQIIPLKYTDGAEISKLLEQFISPEGKIITHSDSNMLLVVDKWINIQKVLRLVEVFDADFLDRIAHRFYFLKYAKSEEASDILEKIIGFSDRGGRTGFQIISMPRLNALLVVSKDDLVFEKIDEYLLQIDVPSETFQRQIYVYSVKNGTANDLAALLNTIFGSSNSETETIQSKTALKQAQKTTDQMNPFMQQPAGVDNQPAKPSEMPASASPAASATVKDKVNITPDEIRNSLIIEATQSDYRIIENILSKLDVLPRQVLIEATIVEVTLDDKTELGVEWAFGHGAFYQEGGLNVPGTTYARGTAGSGGLLFSIGELDRWSAVLSAFASRDKLNVIATPSIMASDNKEAVINISEEIPVISATYDVTTGSDTNLRTTNVQYRNTGLILNVTPHINENGLVNMTISQEYSQPTAGVPIGGVTYPTFFKRTVNTDLVVNHNQTIVIGGLISETKNRAKAGIPILSKIPGIGFLFGAKNNTSQKRELIILITPRVIVQLDDVDAITDDFKLKLSKAFDQMASK